MTYEAAFALHLTAVALFAGTLVLTGAVLPGIARGGPEARRLWRLNAWVASPALLLLWAAGALMAVQAGWLAMGWLRVKLPLVVLLSILHGRQMALLRRIARGRAVRRGYGLLAIEVAALVIVAGLASAKPF